MAASIEAVELRAFIHHRLRDYAEEIDLVELKAGFASVMALTLDGKADKVTGGTANNFAKLVLDIPTGKYNIADSGENPNSFARVSHDHDSRYLRKDASNSYDATQYVFTYANDATHAPFAVSNATVMVTNLNSELLGGFKASQFALAAHTHDTRYLRLDANNDYNAGLHTFTFTLDTEAPFAIVSTSGTSAVVTYLNADLLDGYHASSFSQSNHLHDTRYLRLEANNNYDSALYTFTFTDTLATGNAPFAVASSSAGKVINLDADKLDGQHAAYFATASHTHAWGIITGTLSNQTDLQAALDNKLSDIGQTGAPTLDVVLVSADGGTVYRSGAAYNTLATTTQIAIKANMVTGATVGNFAKLLLDVPSGKYDIADSGNSAADFALASHDHDTRYFTETELTNYSTALALKGNSTIESATYYVAGSSGVTSAAAAAAGAVNIRINGVSYDILYK